MTAEIYKGHDCCRDALKPTKKPTIYPKNITLDTGESIKLYLRAIHPGCYESCYTWKILYGAGWLNTDTGIEVWYHAPEDNPLCLSNPVIEASCTRGPLDTIFLAINGFPKPVPAVLKIATWKQHEFELVKFYPHLVGMKYCDKVPRVHFWTLRIDEYGCDSSHTNRYQLALVGQLVEAVCGIKIVEDSFFMVRPFEEEWLRYGPRIALPLLKAQGWALTNWRNEYRGNLWDRNYYKFGIEAQYHPKELLGPFVPGVNIDVRPAEIFEMDCCPYLLA